MDAAEWTEIDVVEELAKSIEGRRAVPLPGSGHLFADASLSDYDERSAELLRRYTLKFLSRRN